jgi:hypothetical protein
MYMRPGAIWAMELTNSEQVRVAATGAKAKTGETGNRN